MLGKNSIRSVLTIQQFSDLHPAFTTSSLRSIRFYQESNGFAEAFLTLGSRVLIDEDLFFKCLDRLNGKEAAS
jgi:hypothetical protein